MPEIAWEASLGIYLLATGGRSAAPTVTAIGPAREAAVATAGAA